MMTSHTVTARKSFQCQDICCDITVEAGDEYARHVAFPNDDDLGNDGFWVLKICQECETRYGRAMPPRKRRAA